MTKHASSTAPASRQTIANFSVDFDSPGLVNLRFGAIFLSSRVISARAAVGRRAASALAPSA
jgi:hypothetical protein